MMQNHTKFISRNDHLCTGSIYEQETWQHWTSDDTPTHAVQKM